ncbi:hypothetical protein [Streptomyces sp. SID4982]|uniref:hypothetical protein n=1 Tax=Streptomyces sp. SID4982 TaxID=2690291 RepID=UPI00136ACB63|nr:hypothetical protein [Streptomyces sp. SID4982]MYS15069.1 hypothetical protein [Streptomyces sp. SID4982]
MNHRIDGPTPMRLTATEQGANLDISRYLQTVFLNLFAAADDDPEGFGEELADMYSLATSAQHQGPDSHARHEFDARMQTLIDQHADGGTIRLYQTGLRDLRDAADHISRPRPVPSQRKESAA